MNSSWDDDALVVYESAMPNHEILPFVGSWESTDALHCRVKGIPDLSLMEFNVGDINQDNMVNGQDIIILVSVILNGESNIYGDLNMDGTINILDVVQIVNIILGRLS